MAANRQQLAEDSLQEQANKVLDQARYLADSIVPGGSGAVSPSVFLGGLVTGLSIWHAVAPSSVDEAFALVPHHTIFTVVGICPIPFVWNVTTGHFFEGHVLKAVLAVPSVVVLGRLLEGLWTAKAIAMHILFTVTCAGAAFFLTELIHVYRTHHEKDFFIPVNGCVGLVTAMAVGIRHAYPLEPLPYISKALPKGFRLKYQHLPFTITVVACILGFLFPGDFTEWLFAPFAFFFGWLHIRYVMWFPHSQAHGDHSADFLFSSMFPRVFRPLVGCLGTIVHKLVSLVVPSFVQLRTQVDCESGGGSITSFGASSGAGAAGHPGASSAASSGAGSLRPGGAAGAAGGAAGASGADGGPVLPGGPGSAEYAARRAKALALLDQNIAGMLAPSSSSAASGAASGRSSAAGASARSVEMDDKISALLASTKAARKQQQQQQQQSQDAPTVAAAAPAPAAAEGGAPAPAPALAAPSGDEGGGSEAQPPMANGSP